MSWLEIFGWIGLGLLGAGVLLVALAIAGLLGLAAYAEAREPGARPDPELLDCGHQAGGVTHTCMHCKHVRCHDCHYAHQAACHDQLGADIQPDGSPAVQRAEPWTPGRRWRASDAWLAGAVQGYDWAEAEADLTRRQPL